MQSREKHTTLSQAELWAEKCVLLAHSGGERWRVVLSERFHCVGGRGINFTGIFRDTSFALLVRGKNGVHQQQTLSEVFTTALIIKNVS